MAEEQKEAGAAEITQTPAEGSASEGESSQGTSAAEAGASEEGAKTPLETSGAEGETEKEAPAPYKGRDKFKVMVSGSDEQKEHDVPDFLKGLIKDEASEKQVIELLEKAYGLEPVKTSRAAAQKERDQYKNQFTQVTQSIADVRKAYQRGDIDSFLDKLQIPHERMLQWALDKVNYSQLPPEHQKIIDDRREAQRVAYAAEQQAETYGTQVQEIARQAKSMLLQSGLARPDVKDFASAYDSQVGEPGAFAKEVIQAGEIAWIQSNGKVDLTPDQAIEQAMGRWKKFIQPKAAVAQSATQTGAGVIQPDPKAAVIPNVQGRSSSPMKSKPRSVDDLKKLRDQHANS